MDECAVDFRIAWWTTPGEISFRAIGGSNTPHVWSKGGEVVPEIYAEGTMGQSCGDGVLEIVDAVASGFATIAKVDPRMRVLMHEQRYADGCEIAVTFVAITIAPQCVP